MSRLPELPDAVVKARYLLHLRRELAASRAEPIVVFSPGKVGSTSLMASAAAATSRPVLHCHRIARERRAPDPRWGGGGKRPFVQWRGDYLRGQLRRHREQPWDIVSGVREPISRAVSTLFQIGSLPDANTPHFVESMVENLAALFRARCAELDWFGDQLEAVTGIDVFSQPFDHAAGWQIYETSQFRVLVVRFEDLSSAGPVALQKFFGLEEAPSLVHKNDAKRKDYAHLYSQFRERATLPADLLEMAYESALARHFYTDAERAAFRSRWERD
jgi:hypothetical protein